MSIKELSPDERRCVAVYLKELRSRTGTSWRVGPKLSRQFSNERTPECVLISGSNRVAVEVKRLFDSESPSVYGNAVALEKRLRPKVRGHIVVVLPSKYRGKRLSRALEPNIQAEIERVAPMLEFGQKGYIRVYHRSELRLDSSGHSRVVCYHGHQHRGIERLWGRVNGLFKLDDNGTAGKVHTDEAADDFERAPLAGCQELTASGRKKVPVDWHEEWQILKVRGSGVSVPTSAGGWVGPEAIKGPLAKVLREGNRKFQKREWAPISVLLIYDLYLGGVNAEDVRLAFHLVERESYANLDEVWLLSGGEISPLYRK